MEIQKQYDGKKASKDPSEEKPADNTLLNDTDDLGEARELIASDEARRVAAAIAASGLDKKAAGVEVIDVTGKVDYAELLVLMTGRSDRHVHAIAKGVQEDLKREKGVAPLSVEGLSAAQWVLLDFNDVVVHVFQQDTRTFYDIEGLWIDAQRVSVPHPPKREGQPGRGEASEE